MAVVAHPDDDTFGCAGTVALHAEDPDFRFTLVHVTSGEAGEIADPSLATRATLGRVREQVDRLSWEALGRVPDRHEFLRPPVLADIFAGLDRSGAGRRSPIAGLKPSAVRHYAPPQSGGRRPT